MQVTFDTANEKDVQDVQALLNMLTGGQTTAMEATADVEAETSRSEDTKAADEAAAKKKADAAAKKKADEAAAKKKADAAAKKKAEEEAAAAEAEAAEEEDEKEDDTPSVSREDVKNALKDYAALEGKDAAITILKDHGAASITELAEDKYADVIAACG
ncbi:membrane spanning protein TolA [Roseobacter phage RDJL Phi 1]|uniref:Membrane spanning protein TolA n=1 Tax=Roseobacter phage RDJL Phi 1 TaxID=562742 RepID=F4YXQ7_9CAUD|nr:membrane spanning protein TolA [Roseobacter phage RDJL Phi 1]ADK73447.1 membrane spanning protein TolA [Roseobacter phage RDJL Phi 1]